MNAPYFVRKTNLQSLDSVRVHGRAAIDDYGVLQAYLAERCGADAAALFAEPVVTRGNGAAPSTVSWYAAIGGEPITLRSLDAEARAVPEQELRRRLEALRPALDDPQYGDLVASSLYLASPDDVLVCEGQPVLTNWGLVPNGSLSDPRSRERHFAATLGPYAPFPAPELDGERKPRPPIPPGAAAAAAAAAARPSSLSAAATPPGAAAGAPAGPGAPPGGSGPGAGAPPPGMPPGGPGVPPAGPPGPPVVPVAVPWYRRPWLPVLIAVILATAFLLFLLLPGVLLYPPRPTADARPDLDNALALQREINRALEEQIRLAEQAIQQGVCTVRDPSGQSPGVVPVIPGRTPGTPGGPATPIPSGPSTPGAPATPGTPSTPPGPSGALPGGPAPGQQAFMPSQTPEIVPGPAREPSIDQPAQLLPPQPEATRVPPAARPNQAPFEGSLVDLLDQTTVLVVSAGHGQVSVGSGFFVAPGLLATNLHVIQNADPGGLHVTNRALGGLRPATMVYRTAGAEIGTPDFAVLQVPDAANLPFLSFTPTVGRLQPVVAAGFPTIVMEADLNYQALLRGDTSAIPAMAVTQGVVTVVQNTGQRFPIIAHTASISPGNSGGPLVDVCGRVVGINTFGRIDQAQAHRINYAIAADNLEAFLRRSNVAITEVAGACVNQTALPPVAAATPPAASPPAASPPTPNPAAPGGATPGTAPAAEAPSGPAAPSPPAAPAAPGTPPAATPSTPAPAAPTTPAAPDAPAIQGSGAAPAPASGTSAVQPSGTSATPGGASPASSAPTAAPSGNR